MAGKVRTIGTIIVIFILMTACSSNGLSIKRNTFTFKASELQDLSPDMFVSGAPDIIQNAKLDIIVDESLKSSKGYNSDGSLIAIEGLRSGEYEGIVTSGNREVTFRIVVE